MGSFHHLKTIPDPAAVSSAAAPPPKSIWVCLFLFQIGASSLILTFRRGRRSGFPRGFVLCNWERDDARGSSLALATAHSLMVASCAAAGESHPDADESIHIIHE